MVLIYFICSIIQQDTTALSRVGAHPLRAEKGMEVGNVHFGYPGRGGQGQRSGRILFSESDLSFCLRSLFWTRSVFLSHLVWGPRIQAVLDKAIREPVERKTLRRAGHVGNHPVSSLGKHLLQKNIEVQTAAVTAPGFLLPPLMSLFGVWPYFLCSPLSSPHPNPHSV